MTTTGGWSTGAGGATTVTVAVGDFFEEIRTSK